MECIGRNHLHQVQDDVDVTNQFMEDLVETNEKNGDSKVEDWMINGPHNDDHLKINGQHNKDKMMGDPYDEVQVADGLRLREVQTVQSS